MRLIIPEWVHHDGKAIFSVDVHPLGGRFATGGQGTDSGRVVVWNWAPLLSEKAANDPSVPKMLCLMDQHLGCVNCVRWSMSGEMLASGGDDTLIKIWKKAKGGGGPVFGSKGVVTTENWRCIATLQMHQGDILDLSWSPGDRWLTTCSIDNTIIVWDTTTFTSKIQLSGHSGMVKGVTWDPVGKYLASQSSDKSVRVWRTADWQQEAVITEPFEECGGTTHVLRLSWSPDGQYLVTAHAMNGGGPTAQIIEREGWHTDKDFVGHRKAVTCVRFNNNIMQIQSKKSSKPVQYCCLAIGSRDSSLSVWFTSLNRPVVVIHDLFSKSVMDLSWSSDGMTLLACSWDGHVACLNFQTEEMGRLLSSSEKNALYERLYGQSSEVMGNQTSGRTILESADLLDMTPKPDSVVRLSPPKTLVVQPPEHTVAIVDVQIVNPDKKNTTLTVPNTNCTRPINKQIETRTSDGKRRITPMFIPVNMDSDPIPNGSPCFSSSSPSKSNIVVEKRDSVYVPNVSSGVTSLQPPQIESTNSMSYQGPAPISDNRMNNKLKRYPDAPIHGPTMAAKVPRLTVTSPKQPATNTVISVVPIVSPQTVSFTGSIVRQAGKYKAQFTNNVSKLPQGVLHCIKLYATDVSIKNPQWQYFTGSPMVFASCSISVTAVSCDDSSLHALVTETGVPALPVLSLPGPAIRILQSQAGHLAAFTACGSALVWVVATRRSHIKESFRHLMGQAVLSTCALTEYGMPIITLSNGKSYSYCPNLQTWLVLCNPRDPVQQIGMAASSRGPASPKGHPLSIAQMSAVPSTIMYSSNNTYQHSATLSFLESQISACEALQSPSELSHWLDALVAHLESHGPEVRLRRLLTDLLGPANGIAVSKKTQQWNHELLGLHKHTLLERALKILRKNVKWQRMYTEFTDQLKEIKLTL